ncbi:MAG: rRNA maturation RNase YbeY [Alphaproteobacteria bacterium]|nr:rRNA maturation RNase YbeY [Alphaproteobacteria bacterium]
MNRPASLPTQPSLAVQIEIEDEGWHYWPKVAPTIERATGQVSDYLTEHRLLPLDTGQSLQPSLTLVLGSDMGIQQLNLGWRGIDRPTNVLSFPALEAEVFAEGALRNNLPNFFDGHCGDIYLARETIEREAQDQNKEFAHHLHHLTIHAILHIFGFDHQEPSEATRMERVEIELLHQSGIANPYELPPLTTSES